MLVLDDLHLAGDERVYRSLTYLLDHMPATLHLAVATREDPDLPLARLRARDEVVEIRAGQLRFSDAEAAAFLARAFGLELAAAEVSALQRRTEGWAAALQLAGLSAREHGPAALAAFGGAGHIVDYLAAEVLELVPAELRRFMVACSVASRMSGSLCEALTGDPRAAERLAELERRNLFTVALDPQRRWYRFHPLFADVLRAELAADPERAAALHCRAARWWLAVDAVPEAIGHAIAAGDDALVRELVATHWSAVFNRGWLTTVARWLAALPEADVAADTRLWLARAWTLLDTGALEEIGRWLDAAAAGPDPERRAWGMVLTAIHRFKTGDLAGARAAAALDDGEIAGEPAFRGTVRLLAGALAAFWDDGRPGAAPLLERLRRWPTPTATVSAATTPAAISPWRLPSAACSTSPASASRRWRGWSPASRRSSSTSRRSPATSRAGGCTSARAISTAPRASTPVRPTWPGAGPACSRSPPR